MSDLYEQSGPHIGTSETVSKSMLDVMVALSPALVASVVFFGPYSLYLVFATAASATVFEALLSPRGYSWKRPIGDFSGFGAGYILGLTLSPGSPWWIPILGAFLLVVIGKHAFGGLGNNIFNPALVARGILLIGWPALVTDWQTPLAFWQTGTVDAFTAPTPLVSGEWSYLQLFLGNIPGSIGETSVLALLLGFGYLQLRGHRLQRIVGGVVIGTVLGAIAFGTDPILALFSGSIMYTALFMATDFVTSPMGRTPHWIFGLGIGFLTVVIREYGIYPEGSTFAVLFMNATAYFIDKIAADPKFGEVSKRTLRRSSIGGFALASVLFITIAGGAIVAWQSADESFVSGQTRRDLRTFFPDAGYALPMELEVESVRAEEVFASDGNQVGYLVYAAANGYNGPIRVVVALDRNYEIDGLRIREEKESRTLGALIHRDYFLSQFLGLTPDTRGRAAEELAHISGATISSRATANAIESALGFLDEPDDEEVEGFDDLEDGTFTGVGSGYAGDVELEVIVDGGRITSIETVSHSDTRRIFDSAWGTLRDAIIDRQSTDVDSVSGATGSSNGIIEAVNNALGR